jgi:hypothetical protein
VAATILSLAFRARPTNIGGMAFKPNYNQQRAERDRLKRAKREEKLRLQAERTAARKGEQSPESAEDQPASESPAGEKP